MDLRYDNFYNCIFLIINYMELLPPQEIIKLTFPIKFPTKNCLINNFKYIIELGNNENYAEFLRI